MHLGFEQSAARCLAKLRSGGDDALVIDARSELGGVEESSALSLLRGLFGEHDPARLLSRRGGNIAICLAGDGTEGLLC